MVVLGLSMVVVLLLKFVLLDVMDEDLVVVVLVKGLAPVVTITVLVGLSFDVVTAVLVVEMLKLLEVLPGMVDGLGVVEALLLVVVLVEVLLLLLLLSTHALR